MKIKVLWLCNIILPEVMRCLGKKPVAIGGWLSGMLEGIMNDHSDVDICLCMPCSWINELKTGHTTKFTYYLFPFKQRDTIIYDDKIQVLFQSIIGVEKPCVVHIWGTEFPYTLAMVNACENLGILHRTVINIQGLVSVYAQHYFASLPFNVIHDPFTIRNLIFHDNIARQQRSFVKRGEYEVAALKKVHHVIGRTDWDYACVAQINPSVQYHFCGEILRNSFYEHEWHIEDSERHSIFVSQAIYPIKGLHFVLEAMPLILRRYHDAHLFVAGPDITYSGKGVIDQLKLTSYGKYIKKLIKNYDLKHNITFCGPLNEEEMCARYLSSNVFVSASSIENSPNSVCEAMILGMPVVSSDVGGVKNLLEHNKEGFIYQHDAPYMLAFYVSKIFASNDTAVMIGRYARQKALDINGREKHVRTTINIYNDINSLYD